MWPYIRLRLRIVFGLLEFTILKNYIHRARGANTHRAREGRRDESTVNNTGSKLKFLQAGALGNFLLFPSMDRGTRESKYRRIVVNRSESKGFRILNNLDMYSSREKSRDLLGNPPCRYMVRDMNLDTCTKFSTTTTGEGRQKGLFGHADYCNFVNF